MSQDHIKPDSRAEQPSNAQPPTQSSPVYDRPPAFAVLPSYMAPYHQVVHTPLWVKVLVIVAVLLGLGSATGVGYLLWQNRQNPPVFDASQSPITPSEYQLGSRLLDKSQATMSAIPNAIELDTRTDRAGWQTATFVAGSKTIKLQIPPSIVQNAAIEQSSTQGETGTQICHVLKEKELSFIPQAYAGGAHCLQGILTIGAISGDYKAGRTTGFSDTKGYVQKGTTFFVKGISGEVALNNSSVALATNAQGVQYLKIMGENDGEDGAFPISGTPGKDRIGAIINLDDPDFPALSLDMELSETYTQSVFNSILESLTIN